MRSSFAGEEMLLRQEKARKEYFGILKGFDAA